MTGWVYKIIKSDNQQVVYVGSTFGKYFSYRKCGHTKPSTFTNGKQQNLYGYIQQNGGWSSFEIKIDKEFTTEEETRNEEKSLIQELKPICNVQHVKSAEERQQQHNEWQKDYFKKNPDQYQKALERSKINAKDRCATQIECPCGGRYTLQNKTNHYKRNIHIEYEVAQSRKIGETRKEMESNL